MDIKDTVFPPKTYLVWRKEIEIKNIMDQTMWQSAYAAVHEYIEDHDLDLMGPGAALYFSSDTETGKVDIGIGNAVEGADEVRDPELTLVDMPESKAVMMTVHGAYNNFPEHHAALVNYLKERGLKETLTIEEYIITGMDKPDPNDWETNIYHLYE